MKEVVEHYGSSQHSWIQTYSGKKFHVLESRPEDMDIIDIAHSLSLMNRYTGHTRVAYSVAEHSVRVLWCVMDMIPAPDKWAMASIGDMIILPTLEKDRWRTCLAALLHDCSEAYLNDIARPVKMIDGMSFYRGLERGLEECAAKKWSIQFPWPKIVKKADEILLVTEKRDLMGPSPAEWVIREAPLPGKIEPWPAQLAEFRFLQEYNLLMDRLGLKV